MNHLYKRGVNIRKELKRQNKARSIKETPNSEIRNRNRKVPLFAQIMSFSDCERN